MLITNTVFKDHIDAVILGLFVDKKYTVLQEKKKVLGTL